MQEFCRTTIYFVLLLIIKVLCIMTVCLYSYLSYPARKPKLFSAILYCHLWPDSLHHIFSHLLIIAQFSERKKNCPSNVFRFSFQILPNFFFNLRRIQNILYSYIYLGLHAKSPDILVHFQLNFNFLNIFSKNGL